MADDVGQLVYLLDVVVERAIDQIRHADNRESAEAIAQTVVATLDRFPELSSETLALYLSLVEEQLQDFS